MTVDISDLTEFARELRESAREVTSGAPKLVKKGADNIKKAATATLSVHGKSLGRLKRAVTYDQVSEGDLTEYEIGPDQDISGLGRGVEFGSSHTAPMPFLHPAFDDEAPTLEEQAEALVVKAFRL